uniref:Uncharacterized protein n=1 Tax=Triticum urartu TaxID=4572 RepID=A0A8R7USH0_TRIUA
MKREEEGVYNPSDSRYPKISLLINNHLSRLSNPRIPCSNMAISFPFLRCLLRRDLHDIALLGSTPRHH